MTNWIKNLRTFVGSLNWDWLVMPHPPSPLETAAILYPAICSETARMSARTAMQTAVPAATENTKYLLAVEAQRARLNPVAFAPLTQRPSCLGQASTRSRKAESAGPTVVNMQEWLGSKLSDGSIK